ncbi:hypothetical protein N7481_008300 [Penicillium waksmanii]|uniref:uncharacterized protein n=1 Tax=Penicillium waksmanii TaxID=69791 RepID=UPI002547E24C|nr:uncharacterized protein N7481_008300 [Penicillium waksmanii]KAJ5981002.1 hypothetical protein N7481_008300 [Penicillium waksmanii]
MDFKKFAYPGASQWPITSIQVQEAIVVQNENRCSATGVTERPARAEDLIRDSVTNLPYINTEHLVELKLIKTFMNWAMKECEGIDC